MYFLWQINNFKTLAMVLRLKNGLVWHGDTCDGRGMGLQFLSRLRGTFRKIIEFIMWINNRSVFNTYLIVLYYFGQGELYPYYFYQGIGAGQK